MMSFSLCNPARVYLGISAIALFIMLVQNFGNSNVYCLGTYTCDVPSIEIIFLVKMLYIFFWTWVLQLLCKNGYTSVSWFLVLLPFIAMFVVITLLLIVNDLV